MNEEKLVELLKTHFPTKSEINLRFTEVYNRFDEVIEKLDDLKASAGAVDDILEQHPVPRIERIEKHLGLPKFVSAISEE
ncbi:MAG: hypothetical protein A2749_02710 [Parcubacteria group bacterium RIFCSPHIGHO2_01_FULL_45_26]|nr:MAG: hypothetical protein A2749_02710 [Parcubacteria group bacterium RIFCSPHIGHO2_01_FULL_45_26]